VVVDSSASIGLDDFDLHAGPLRTPANNGIRWGNPHYSIGHRRGLSMERPSPGEISVILNFR
jgi:hypothetical protein